jgi:hypothetical protein
MTTPTSRADDDAHFATLLRAGDDELADDGFSERVMARIARVEQRSTLDPHAALARWQRDERAAGRHRRWQGLGAVVGGVAGAVIALLPMALGATSAQPLQLPQQGALALALVVAAWALAAPLFDRGGR